MKADKVLQIWQITRPTLQSSWQKGYIKATELPNGHYDFDADSVYCLHNRNKPGLTVLYGRVSTYKQRNDLTNQMQALEKCATKKRLHYG